MCEKNIEKYKNSHLKTYNPSKWPSLTTFPIKQRSCDAALWRSNRYCAPARHIGDLCLYYFGNYCISMCNMNARVWVDADWRDFCTKTTTTNHLSQVHQQRKQINTKKNFKKKLLCAKKYINLIWKWFKKKFILLKCKNKYKNSPPHFNVHYNFIIKKIISQRKDLPHRSNVEPKVLTAAPTSNAHVINVFANLSGSKYIQTHIIYISQLTRAKK